MTDGGRRELILYATPIGQLAEQCERFFREAAQELGPTTAHAYPPHVTLTGFFHRVEKRVVRVVDQLDEQLADVGVLDGGVVPAGAVEVAGLTTDQDWVGLRISSPWLIDLTAALVWQHELTEGDDALRPKDWLHLSLAYGGLGADRDISQYGELATRLVDPNAEVLWQVCLWERRHDGSFCQLKATPS